MEYVRVSVILIYVLVCCTAASRIRRRWAVDDDGCRTPKGGIGECKRISECQAMNDFLKTKNKFSEKEKSTLSSYRCGFYGHEVKVCCPNSIKDLEWVYDDDGCPTPDGGVGNCINIMACKSIREYIEQNNNLSEDIKEAIRRYECGVDGDKGPKVCCPEKLPNFISTRITEHSTHPNVKLLPMPCGKSASTDRITYGNQTNLFEFPWAAVLKYDKRVNPYSCGASLINERYVLTAAHCVRSANKLISVRLGEYDFRNETDCDDTGECATKPQDFEISSDDAIVHPGYNATTVENDIALIRLRTPANTTVYSVSSVCLPITIPEKTYNFKNYTVIGWGATETGYSSPILLKVSVPKVETSDCQKLYRGIATIGDNQLCAGGRNLQDSCAGDSGGPIMGDYTVKGLYKVIQYGIVSFGPRICGRLGTPAVYTKISDYMDWILDNLRE